MTHVSFIHNTLEFRQKAQALVLTQPITRPQDKDDYGDREYPLAHAFGAMLVLDEVTLRDSGKTKVDRSMLRQAVTVSGLVFDSEQFNEVIYTLQDRIPDFWEIDFSPRRRPTSAATEREACMFLGNLNNRLNGETK